MENAPKQAHSVRLMLRDDVLKHFIEKSEEQNETLSLVINRALLQTINEQQALSNL